MNLNYILRHLLLKKEKIGKRKFSISIIFCEREGVYTNYFNEFFYEMIESTLKSQKLRQFRLLQLLINGHNHDHVFHVYSIKKSLI